MHSISDNIVVTENISSTIVNKIGNWVHYSISIFHKIIGQVLIDPSLKTYCCIWSMFSNTLAYFLAFQE